MLLCGVAAYFVAIDKSVVGSEKTSHAQEGGHSAVDNHEGEHSKHGGHDAENIGHEDDYLELENDEGETGHNDHDAGEAGHDDHVEKTKINAESAKKLNIKISQVGDGVVQERLSVSGIVALNQNNMAQVKARFAGIVRSVAKQQGQIVQAGEVLATVEGNDSLLIYPVKSPITGTIIARNTNIGEVASDIPLFTVADLGTLWAELFVFSKDSYKLQAGQKVSIQCLDDPVHAHSTIAMLLPTSEANSQSLTARVVLDNKQNHWRSGMNIRADVVLSEKAVAVAVKTQAIQQFHDENVVFLVDGESYSPQIVKIGVHDSTWSEITSGLSGGEKYVSTGSFLVKADMQKSSAEHSH